MRRGFKAQAERLAAELRTKLSCADDKPVPLDDLASHLGVELVSAERLVARARLEELAELQDDAFSAGTFRLPSGRRVVVYNPLHSQGRSRSDQAHELAHLLLGHEVRTIERVGNLTFVTCDTAQEEEADWLAGCLLLPRPLLMREAAQGRDPAAIAARHDTSEAMARFRLNASGVLVQLGRVRARQVTRPRQVPAQRGSKRSPRGR